LGVGIRIDGGWSVDALLGEQSRSHQDFDIAIEEKNGPKLREMLRGRGYKEIKMEHARDFVSAMKHEIDVHVIVFDSQGNGIYGPKENGEMDSAGSLTGTGLIEGRTVRCISPEWMVKFRSSYEVGDEDFRDVSALCTKFGMDCSSEYARFRE
jgi:lincosamide nucleotidyltransferase A/C/D/E